MLTDRRKTTWLADKHKAKEHAHTVFTANMSSCTTNAYHLTSREKRGCLRADTNNIQRKSTYKNTKNKLITPQENQRKTAL